MSFSTLPKWFWNYVHAGRYLTCSGDLIILLKVNCKPVKRQIAFIYLPYTFTQEVEFPSLFILFFGVLYSDYSLSYSPLHPGLTFFSVCQIASGWVQLVIGTVGRLAGDRRAQGIFLSPFVSNNMLIHICVLPNTSSHPACPPSSLQWSQASAFQ